MFDQLAVRRELKPSLLVVVGALTVGLCALAATILASFATKYLIMVCAAAAGGLIFLLSLMDYSVPSLFGVNVYAMEIFAEFIAGYEPARAFRGVSGAGAS